MYINIAAENWITLAIKSDIIIYPVFRGVFYTDKHKTFFIRLCDIQRIYFKQS